MMARLGALWFGASFPKYFLGVPPRVVCVRGALQNFRLGSPPLLRGVQEVGTLVGLVARMGACLVGSG